MATATKNEKRLEVLKTYKIYIGGQFPRTESGRYYIATNSKKENLANVCLSSRKDFRDAVGKARGAFGGWSGRAAFNRGQILYRIAEMLEGRKAQFVDELMKRTPSGRCSPAEVAQRLEGFARRAGEQLARAKAAVARRSPSGGAAARPPARCPTTRRMRCRHRPHRQESIRTPCRRCWFPLRTANPIEAR